MQEAHDTFVSYQKAVHNSILLPTVDHSNFLNDKDQQSALLQFLYNKIAIEHRNPMGGSHELFLQFDEDRRGVLSQHEFCDALERVGVTLNDDQLTWLIGRFDCDHDGGVDYNEFVRMLSAWRGQGQTGTGSVNTGLTWDFEKPAESPHKKADEQREANREQVEQQYARAHNPRRDSLDGMAAKEVLAKLSERVYEVHDNLKHAFTHFDRDSDHRLSRAELGRAFEELNLEVPEDLLEQCYAMFHVEPGAGGIKHFEFVRTLSEACEGTGVGVEDPSVLPSSSTEVPVTDETDTQTPETDGDGDQARTDQEVLLAVATALHEKGLAAHGAIKHLMPEADGTVDERELQTMLQRLHVPVSLARARRLMSRADLMHDGRLTGWEFVRLLSFATEEGKA